MLEQFGSMVDMVKKVQQVVGQVEEQLKNELIEVNSGDAIRVVVNGQQTLIRIELSPKYLNPESAPLLQDLLVNTLNSALDKSRETHRAAMAKLAADLHLPNIPGLF